MKKIIFGLFIVGLIVVAGGVYAATSTVYSPTVCTNNGWVACSRAFVSDNFRARSSVGAAGGIWRGYQFKGALTKPTKFEVGVEGIAENGFCQNTAIFIAVSTNGGVSFGPDRVVSLPCDKDLLTWKDVTSDVASNSFSSSLFQVRAKCGFGSTCRLDWLPVRVTQ